MPGLRFTVPCRVLLALCCCAFVGVPVEGQGFSQGQGSKINVKIGVVVDDTAYADHIRQYFAKAEQYVNTNGGSQFTIRIIYRNGTLSPPESGTHPPGTPNSHLASELICSAISAPNVAALMGPTSVAARDYAYKTASRFDIPFLDVDPVAANLDGPMTIQLYPKIEEIFNATAHLVLHPSMNWNKIIFFYDDSSGLDSFSELFTDYQAVKVVAYSMADYMTSLNILRDSSYYKFVVHCRPNLIVPFLNKALELQMMKKEYGYHFLSLELDSLDLSHFSYGGANITGFRLLGWGLDTKLWADHPQFKLTPVGGVSSPRKDSGSGITRVLTRGAMIVDAVRVFAIGMQELIRQKKGKWTAPHNMFCNSVPTPWEDGVILLKKMKRAIINDGLTGPVEFDDLGHRRNYTLKVVSLDERGESMTEIGNWTRESTYGWKFHDGISRSGKYRDTNRVEDYTKKILNVAVKREAPYVEYDSSENGTGGAVSGRSNRFKGFCIELLWEIAKKTNINYDFNFFEVDEVGEGIKNAGGGWSGMIGHVINETADLGVGAVTITSERDNVIDFTTSFMSMGISILYTKPEKEPPGMLSFMDPISYQVWAAIVVALVVVSLGIWLLARICPSEWENPYPCQEDYPLLTNSLGLMNSFWFSLGSLMQQGSDVLPKGASTRLVAISWWLFTLVIISSYTANLAAFLTIATFSTSFENAEELSDQTVIKFGCTLPGSTCNFFKNSKIDTYESMWAFMSSTSSNQKLPKSGKEGVARVKAGGYAFLMESKSLTYEINTDTTCKLKQVGQLLNSIDYGIIVRKGSMLEKMFTTTILRLREDQVLLDMYNRWWKVNDNPCVGKDSGTSGSQLEIENLGGVFVFLICGMGVAALILVVEITFWSWERCKKNKTSLRSTICDWLRHSVRGEFPPSLNPSPVNQSLNSVLDSNHIE